MPDPILMNDFTAEPAALQAAMRAAFDRVLASGWFVLGKEVNVFEQSWAEVCGTTHCVGVANGLDAIEIALRLRGIGEGDEVITTPMTAFATTLAILRVGATPRFADIDPASGMITPESAAELIGPATRAIIPVYLFGQVRDADRWADLCRQHGIDLIEDCAQAQLARWKGRPAGSFGIAGAWSFYPTKNLGALGDAGALVTSDADFAAAAARYRNYGQSVRYHHPDAGQNSRLDELQAALLLVRLQWIEAQTTRRREIAAKYRAGLSNEAVTLLAPPVNVESHVYHLFVVCADDRDALSRHLASAGVQTHVHYPIVTPDQPPCAHLGPIEVPRARRFADTCLSLPVHPQLNDVSVARVIDAVNGFGR